MATIDTKDPKALVAGILACVGLIGGGSMLGLTIEPEGTTELRIEHGKLQESTKHLDSQLKECQEDLAKKESKKGVRQSQKGSE